MSLEEKRIEKHLYERHYQTATGEWSRSYYVRLKDWKGVRRVWPAGNKLRSARIKRAEYEHRNGMREDFDKDKVKDLTFAKWTEIYLAKFAQGKRSYKRDVLSCRNLSTFFVGSFLLPQITRRHVEEYKHARKESTTNRNTLRSEASINRELACLKHVKLAAEEGLIDHIPVVKLYRR